MTAPRFLYAGAMLAGGLALALASLRWPIVNDGPIPPLMSLLAVSLVFDLVFMNLVAAGKSAPLHMTERFFGFFAGAVLYFATRQMLVG